MELSVQAFDRICRVCLIESAELTSLFTKIGSEQRNLFEILSFTASINIKIEDSLPKNVCRACESIMCKADAFKRRCIESDTILNNVYQNAAACSDLAIIGQESFIKDEKLDFKHKISEFDTFVSSIPTNSEVTDAFNDKSKTGYSTSNDQVLDSFSDTKILLNPEQLVKEEAITNYDDDNDFIDNFDASENLESPNITSIEFPDQNKVTIKEENKKIAIKYECYCKAQFTNQCKYETHLKLKKCNNFELGKDFPVCRDNKFQCLKCDKKCSTLSAWKVHQRTHSKDVDAKTLFQCSLCLRKCKSKTSLAAHIQRHEAKDNIKHKCEICKREFKYKAYLENHILTTHSKTNGIACDICAQSFISKELLETHKKSHDNEKKHRCTVCSKAFLMLCTLKEHMRTHTGEKPFLCSQCGKGFSQKTNLAQHTMRHQGLKPFKCENCEKRFVSKGELDAHTRKHSGAHPFVCDECGNGFTTSSALVKHRRVHSGERPYACDLCHMRFAATGTLKNHRRTHTGERPFQCSYCEKAFVQRTDLISHIRCHTGERPYVCNQCGQAFRKTSGLKNHVKLHIKDPVVGINAILTGMQCSEQ